MTTQSKTLTAFYRAYAAWLDAGAPEDPVFRRDMGLCSILRDYLRSPMQLWRIGSEEGEMFKQFDLAGLDTLYPFYGGGPGWARLASAYQMECETRTCHLNQQRIQWVLDHIPKD